MTKLSIENNTASTSQDRTHVVEQHPVYHISMPVNSKGQHVGNGHIELSDMNGYGEVETPRKGKGKGKKGSHSSKSSRDSDQFPIVRKGQSQNSLNKSNDNLHDSDDFSDFHSEVDDSGPHREMAIDVPDNFQGAVKVPPRYPPPSAQSSTHSIPHTPPSTPSKTLDLVNNRSKTDNTLEYVANAVSNGHQNTPLREDQIERLKKHQEELRKRREEEQRIAREQEFLRTSLRGSKKLQALESVNKQATPTGVINTAFEEVDYDEDDQDNNDDGFGSARAPSERERYLKKNLGTDELFSCLHHIKNRLNSAEDRDKIAFLKRLFHDKLFQNAVQIHNKMVDVSTRTPPSQPVCNNSVQTSNELSQTLALSKSSYATDLQDLLNKPNFRNLLQAHDQCAEKQLAPTTPVTQENDFMEYPLTQYGEDLVRIVQLEKTNEPLGATVRNDGDAVVIGRIVKGGTAEKSGLLHEGDEILEIDSVEMKGKNINDVSEMLADKTGTIVFMIIPATNYAKSPERENVMHMRAMFNYDPTDDILIPCRELGISFAKGDILHVINQDDPNWWQAYREGEEEHQSLAGLIPSAKFKEIVESNKKVVAADNRENSKKSRTCSCGRREKKKKKRSAYKENEDEEILTYEELVQYYPQPNRKRPIVLIGPPNVGRHELRQRLMESDYDRFAAAVPHTSRPQSAHEQDGKDYHFVPRAVFEADIISNKFIEHGEFQKNLYGTKIDAVQQVINQGRICILNLHAETLPLLRTTDLKPYVLLVYPQNMEKLRQIQQKLGQTRITDEDLKDTVERAREMEDKYGHYIDFILVNSDMDRAYNELLAEINRIEVEPQWVPAHWVN